MSMRAHFQSARRPDSEDSDSDEVPEATGAGWRAQLFARDPDEGMEDDLIGDEELEDGDALGKSTLVQAMLYSITASFSCEINSSNH